MAKFLAEEYEISTVVAEGLENNVVTAELVEVPVGRAIENIAKRLGVETRFENGVFYIGILERSDRGVLVRRVRRLSREDLERAIGSLSSETGSSVAFDDGLVVVSDVVTVIDRISTVFDKVESAGNPGWVCQLHVISYGESAVNDLGINALPAGRLSAKLAGLDPNSFDFSFVAELDGLLQVVSDRSDVELVANPVLVLGDGKTAKFDRVERIPYQTQILEDSGSQVRTRTIVEFLDVGFEAEVALRETGIDSATIELKIKNSNVTAINGDLPPSTAQDQFSSTVPIKANGVYLVGSFVASTIERSKGIGLRSRHREQKSTRTYQVWMRAHQIASLKAANATKPGRGAERPSSFIEDVGRQVE